MRGLSRFILLTACAVLTLVSLAVRPAPRGASTGRGPVIMVANAAQVQEVGRIQVDAIRIVFRPDGKAFALVKREQPVEIRDASDYRLLQLIGTGKKLIELAFNPNGDSVAYCENRRDRVAMLFFPSRGKQIPVATGNYQPDLAFSPDGKLLATGGYGTEVKLWRASDGSFLRSLACGTEGGLRPVFSPNGRILAVGNRNDTTRLFDVASGKLLRTLEPTMTQELAFSPEGERLAVAYVEGTVRLWRVADGRLLGTATCAEETYTVAWSPRGDVLATAGLKSKITLWNTKDLRSLRELPAPESVISIIFSPDGSRLFAAAGRHGRPPQRNVRIFGLPKPLQQRK